MTRAAQTHQAGRGFETPNLNRPRLVTLAFDKMLQILISKTEMSIQQIVRINKMDRENNQVVKHY